MPGHMNVLLAEANVPYPQLREMEDINPEFSRADVALVVGANDVTNPAARSDPGSPIYGMPILDVDEAKSIVVIKRSMGRYAASTTCCTRSKTGMLFADAKAGLEQLTAAVKALQPKPDASPRRSVGTGRGRRTRGSSSRRVDGRRARPLRARVDR